MTQKRLAASRDAHTLGVFLNGRGDPRADAATASRHRRRLVPARSSTRTREPIVFTLPTRRFGARWQVELATARTRRMGRWPRARCARGRGALARAAAASLSAEWTSAARTGSSSRPSSASAARARSSSPTCASSASRTSISRRRCRRDRGSTHGYDVVDPDAHLGRARRRGRAPRALRRGSRRPASASILDIVPNHMAASEEENPFWRDPELRAQFFDWDPATGWYRRFFDIGELGGVRVEDPEVFDETHAKVLELVADGLVDGLRIDHPDGLANPREYLERLRDRGVERVWVEKILEPGEQLRDWPVEGTTGYEFANDVDRAVRRPGRRGAADRAVRGADRRAAPVRGDRARGEARGRADDVRAGVRAAARALPARRARGGRRLAARLPHVRRAASGRVDDDDRKASRSLPDESAPRRPARRRAVDALDEFVTRWQQTTGPVMAKGVEDTAFYRYFRLTALNEVGGDPGRFSLAPDDFHRAALERHDRHPLQLLASQTHDTKRAGDVRARIGALAGMHEEWAARVRRWRDAARAAWTTRTRSTSSGRRSSARGRSSRRGSSSTSRRRCARRSGTTNWLEPDERHERRVQDVRALALREPGVPRRLRAVRGACRARPASTRRSARCCSA